MWSGLQLKKGAALDYYLLIMVETKRILAKIAFFIEMRRIRAAVSSFLADEKGNPISYLTWRPKF